MYLIMRRTVIAFLLLVITCGCGAHQLKQAQDSYNAAARIEAQVSWELSESVGDPLEGDAQALQYYHLSLALVDEALDKHSGSLKKDKLYGTALMLKALCQWRIAALDREADTNDIRDIVKKIEDSVAEEKIVLGTRDRVLLKALPGLQEHTLGLHQSDPDKAKKLFESAINTLNKALVDVNPPMDHPVRSYIYLAEMRSLRAWRWVEYPKRPKTSPDKEKWLKVWIARYEKLRNKVAPLMEANRGLRKQVEKMDKDFGYNPPKP